MTRVSESFDKLRLNSTLTPCSHTLLCFFLSHLGDRLCVAPRYPTQLDFASLGQIQTRLCVVWAAQHCMSSSCQLCHSLNSFSRASFTYGALVSFHITGLTTQLLVPTAPISFNGRRQFSCMSSSLLVSAQPLTPSF